jgi:hypothetical protein
VDAIPAFENLQKESLSGFPPKKASATPMWFSSSFGKHNSASGAMGFADEEL